MRRARPLLQAIVVVSLLAPAAARAQTCTFASGPSTLSFGAYDPGATGPTDSSSTFSYVCTSARARPVLIELSTGGGGAFNPRQLSSGGERLAYGLYSDSTRSTIWGDGTGGSQSVSSVPVGPAHGATLTIYGRIATGQWVAPGAYTDSITVTLNF